MHVITRRRLKDFWVKHPDSAVPLETWYRVMKKERFLDFVHLKQIFGSADYVNGLTVFDIGGNKYRLIVSIHYNAGQVYIRNVLTHTEYDRKNWKRKKQ